MLVKEAPTMLLALTGATGLLVRIAEVLPYHYGAVFKRPVS
jgi:hypothetical protein